ncbi:MAG: serine hydrolase [Clostridiales bacterium]|nr:serine hydrolase [Clostridiales bacterium]
MVHFETVAPEQVGISPLWLESFLDSIERQGLMVHSVMLLRHGKLVMEGYYAPFRREDKHRMYSVSKTFVATAIGMLQDEGRISLEDKVVAYFPDLLPPHVHPWLADATIRDLLRMATPHNRASYMENWTDCVRTFFDTQPGHPPGTVFNYDTAGTYVLNVIVERVTGKPFLDYMKAKGLAALGFSEDAWCVKAPEGYSWGGSGVMCTPRDLALLGQIYLNGGVFNGKRLLSEDYVREATSFQIDNRTDGGYDLISGNGYGYQIWLLKGGGYAFCGMGGQLAICLPQHHLLFVSTADLQGMKSDYAGLYGALYREVVDKIGQDVPPVDREANRRLQARLGALACKPAPAPGGAQLSPRCWGTTYRLNCNPMGIRSFKLLKEADHGVFEYEKADGVKRIVFGFDQYHIGVFPETHYFGDTIGKPAGRPYRCMAAARVPEANKLVLRVYVADDYFGSMTATFAFKGLEVGVHMSKTAEWFLDEYQGFAGGMAE